MKAQHQVSGLVDVDPVFPFQLLSEVGTETPRTSKVTVFLMPLNHSVNAGVSKLRALTCWV